MTKTLDVICIGRSSVDLYGQQVGGRLEEMASFAKYVGGCPTNISIGTARLGLKPGLITGVGDEHMGRFIKEQAAAEGVDISNVKTDPARLTSLVILGIRDQETFPLIFYRENCADAGLTEDDIDEAFIASAKAVLVSGTHFSKPNLDAMSKKAMRLARKHGGRVVFDIDYRPVLWGLTGHGLGEERFVEDREVSAHLQTIVPDCDVVVGTEEEIHIAGGSTDTLEACRRIRALAPEALIVVKRGPMGCTVFDEKVPDDIEQGIKGPGFPVEVFNVLGAGDAFMSGFLRGYLRDEPIETCCKYANACGAFAVSRHGCAPAVPSWTELQYFFEHGSREHALRKDAGLEQIHWSTNRTRAWPQVLAMAFDHRAQLEAMADAAGISHEHISYFKRLCLKAARQAAGERTDFGILLDRRLGQAALDDASGDGIWIGRPIEQPGSLPLRFEGGADVGCTLAEWPVAHCVKCLVYYHPDDPEELAGGAGGAGAAPVRCRAPDRPRAAAGNHPEPLAGAGRRADGRARARPALRDRRVSRLVEARGSRQPGRLGRDRRSHRPARPPLPRRAAARPRRAAGRARGELCARRPPADLQGFCDRTHDLRRAGEGLDGGRDRRRHGGRAHGRDLCRPDPGLGPGPQPQRQTRQPSNRTRGHS